VNCFLDDADDHHQQNQNTGSRGIDMAVVFAKILSQNPSTHHGDKKLEIEIEARNNGLSSSNNNNKISTPKNIETENDAIA
jgi:hypothetical protein